MPQKEIAGQVLDFDDEGFMKEPSVWNEEIAKALANDEGIELTDRHFLVLHFMRSEYEKNQKVPSLRKVKNESGVGTKELYKLFPKGPAKKAARIAGLGKPEGCI